MTPRRLATVVATWSGGFALVHVAWALGWRGGVPVDVEPIWHRPVFLAYDVTAAVLMLAAAYVAVRLARGGLPHQTRHRLATATFVGSVAALTRGVPASVADVATGSWSGIGPWADAWFVVAGVLGLLLWRHEDVRRPVDRERDLALTR